MFDAFRRWRDSRDALNALKRIQTRQEYTNAYVVEGKLEECLGAIGRRDLIRAVQVWDEALAASPTVTKRSRQAAEILIALGRHDEAEAIMLDGMKRFPSERNFFIGHGFVALRRPDYEEALRRWAVMRAKFPRAPEGYRFAAEALSRLGRLEEADEVLSAGLKVITADIMLHYEFARVAAQRGDWQAAFDRWEFVRRAGHHGGITGQAEALRQMGKLDEADEMLSAARFTNPLEPELALEYAATAEARCEWSEAKRRWEDALRRFPRELHVQRAVIQGLIRAGDPARAEAVIDQAREIFPDADFPDVQQIARSR